MVSVICQNNVPFHCDVPFHKPKLPVIIANGFRDAYTDMLKNVGVIFI